MSDLTEEQSELYDRQIRLWGNQVQTRLVKSQLCVIGVNEVQVEFMKSMILAGVNILLFSPFKSSNDTSLVSWLIEKPNFVFTEDQRYLLKGLQDIDKLYSLVASHLNQLNRDVDVRYDSEISYQRLAKVLAQDQTQTKRTTLAVMGSIQAINSDLAISLNHLCRQYQTGFILLASNQQLSRGGAFIDLWMASHNLFPTLEDFLMTKLDILIQSVQSKSNKKRVSASLLGFHAFLQQILSPDTAYPSIPDHYQSLRDTEFKEWMDNSEPIFYRAAISAVMGGFLAQILFRWIQHESKMSAFTNVAIFDGLTCEGLEFDLKKSSLKTPEDDPMMIHTAHGITIDTLDQ